MSPTQRKTAATLLKRAARTRPGGHAGIGRELNVTEGMVRHWSDNRRPIAAAHCPALERLLGIQCEQLRPDLAWIRNNEGQVTGHYVPLALAS